MMEGVFGSDVHLAEMNAAKTRVIGFLLSAITSGHRFIRCMAQARQLQKSEDWKELRKTLKTLGDSYHRFRNYLEHLDEAISKGIVSSDEDGSFFIEGIFSYRDKGKNENFDFSQTALKQLDEVDNTVMEMLSNRLRK